MQYKQAFNIPELSIFRIETGKSHDANITRLIQYFITKPDIARTQLKLTGKRIQSLTLRRLYEYYKR